MAQTDSPSASTVPGLTHCSLPTTAEEETEAPSVRAGQGHPPEPLCPFRRRVLPPTASSPGSASTRGWVGGRPGASAAQTRALASGLCPGLVSRSARAKPNRWGAWTTDTPSLPSWRLKSEAGALLDWLLVKGSSRRPDGRLRAVSAEWREKQALLCPFSQGPEPRHETHTPSPACSPPEGPASECHRMALGCSMWVWGTQTFHARVGRGPPDLRAAIYLCWHLRTHCLPSASRAVGSPRWALPPPWCPSSSSGYGSEAEGSREASVARPPLSCRWERRGAPRPWL